LRFSQAQTAHDNFWDFISLTPESMHMIMWIMSDRSIPRSLRFIEGFGVHTFRLVNAKGESTFVKFHWKPKLGLQSVLWNEAVKINGADPDFHRRDLWTAIQTGNFPEWELQFQLFDQAFADDFDFDVLDPTKIIPEEVLPPVPIGRLVLDRMPDNFFAETEQVAFMTQNVPPGIDFSNDPLLQGRNFSYLDTQLKRLAARISRIYRSTRRNARSIISSRTGIWRCIIPSDAPIISRTLLAKGHGSRQRPALRLSRRKRTAPSSACAPRASPTIIARRGYSISARPKANSIISRLRLPSSLAR
jgi:hypothetical protein